MIIVKDNDVVKKYKFEIDKEKLEKLKSEIIENCSIIRHKKTKVDDRYGMINSICKDKSIYIKNYNMKKIKEVENNDFYGPSWYTVYEEEYDLYDYPDVVDIINEVLKNNEEMIIKLLNYESKEDEINIPNIITKGDPSKIEDSLKKASAAFAEYKLRYNVVPLSKYLPDVKACIKMILIDECSYDDYRRFCKFKDIDENTLSNSFLKHLQKN